MKLLFLIISVIVLVDFQLVSSAGIFNEDNFLYLEEFEKNPPFCRNLPCPKYKVVNKTRDYEIREYEPSKWVETSASSNSFVRAEMEMLFRLRAYITGHNKRNKTIQMALPVATYIPTVKSLEEYLLKNRTFYMALYLHSDAPEPRCNRVRVVKVPKSTYYVRQFGGFVYSERKLINEYKELSRRIGKNHKGFTYAAYDGPKTRFRHNEILVFKGRK